jgi:6-phosphogluconolactonase (cycloisomerase 2 family)
LFENAEALQKGSVLSSSSPGGLRAMEANHKVSLSWDAVGGASGYNLYWSTDPATPLADANKIVLAGNSYTHNGLGNSTTIYYSVSALGYDAESRLSDTISAVPHQYMVYVNNGGIAGSFCNTMGFLMDSEDGSVAESNGSPFNTSSYPKSIIVNPTSRFAYIANYNNGEVTCYTINPESGALAPIGSPVTAGAGVSSLAVHPSGKFLYSVNLLADNLSAFSIDQSSGTLTFIANYPLGYQPQKIVVDPTGRFLYVTVYLASEGKEVAVFSIDSVTGALTKLTSIDGTNAAVDSGVMGIAIHPNGKFLYLTFWNNSTGILVQAITLNTSTGGYLTGQATRKYTNIPSVTNNSEVIEIDPTGKFLYIAMYSEKKIAIYAINQSTGDLTPASGSPFQLWPASPVETPMAIGFDPEGKFAYIVTAEPEPTYTGKLRTHSIDQTSGTLAESGAPITLGNISCDIAVISLP